MMPRMLLLLAALLVSPAKAQQSDAPSEQAESDPQDVGTPEVYPLADVLDPFLSDRLFREADIGIQIVNASTGEEVYAHRADEAYVPASVMKAVTAAVALQTLGPAYRFSTALLTDEDNEIDEEGVLQGDLHVWGGGDPTLVVEDMWRMARDLRLAGVSTIEGDLLFDEHHFDQEYLIDGWRKEEDLTNGPAYFSPIGALTVNYNTTCIVVTPAFEAGMPARVQLETPTELVEIESEVVTGAPGSRPWMTIEREVDWNAGSMHFTMSGSIPVDEDAPWRYYRSVPNPSLHFADVFRRALEQQGVTVRGRNLLQKAPERGLRLLVQHQSASLQTLINDMNKSSSNIIAESILKAIGAETAGVPGTTANGLAVMEEYFIELGIPQEEFTLVNGSGLARGIQLRPTHVNAVLLDMLSDEFLAPEFIASLAVGGRDGTLRRRYDDDEHVGRVRGKTGSINGIYCLAGLIDGGDGQRYVFTFFVNNYRRSSRTVRQLQDKFGVAIISLSPEESSE